MGAAFFAALFLPVAVAIYFPYKFILDNFGFDILTKFSEYGAAFEQWLSENPEIYFGTQEFFMEIQNRFAEFIDKL